METTFQDRMAIVIKRVGDQTKLAAIVTELLGEKVTPQAMQRLASRSEKKKPAQGSVMSAAIATAAGVRPQWLEYGEQPMLDPLAGLDQETRALVLAAVGKLAVPTLDPSVRTMAIGILEHVAKQDVAAYEVSAPTIARTAQKKQATG